MPLPELVRTHRWQTAAVVAAVLVAVAFRMLWLPPEPGATRTVQFPVQSGQGTITIAKGLKSAGLIRSENAFVLYTQLVGVQSSLKAGTYVLSPGMTVPEIAAAIAGGKGLSEDIEVTVPEGVNIWEIDHILSATKLPVTSGQFAATYRAQDGRFFPETYRFRKDADIAAVAVRMQEEFRDRAGSATSEQLIIASILGKEAKSADDMALVSGIIAKRIKLGMPLQVDATVAYGWCLRLPAGKAGTLKAGKLCDVTQAPLATEVKVDGPYNTYTRKGLPPGPISNPGLQALDAAAHPKDSPYLYYLSPRDGSTLIFAKTLDEHLRNRLKYLGF